MSWQIRIRSEKGTLELLNLDDGPETPLRFIKQAVNKASKIPQYKQVWRAGFPPRVVFSPLTKLPASAKVSEVLSDRDLIAVQAATPAELAAAIDAAGESDEDAEAQPDALAASGTADAAPTALRNGAAAGAAAASGGAGIGKAEPMHANSPAVQAASAPEAALQQTPMRTAGAAAGTSAPLPSASLEGDQRPKAKKRKKLEFPGVGLSVEGAVHNGEAAPPKDTAEAVQRAEDSIATALLAAARGGAQVVFRDLEDSTGRVEVSWPSGRKTLRECVPGIPPLLLIAVLVSLYHDADDVVAQNLSPSNMAQVSARTFWALVRHGGVCESVTFEQALQKLVPNLDWAKLRVGGRQRKLPEKLQDGHAT